MEDYLKAFPTSPATRAQLRHLLSEVGNADEVLKKATENGVSPNSLVSWLDKGIKKQQKVANSQPVEDVAVPETKAQPSEPKEEEPAEETEEKPGWRDWLAGLPWMWIGIGVLVLALIVGTIWFFGQSNTNGSFTQSNQYEPTTQPSQSTPNDLPDQSLWTDLAAQPVQDKSPSVKGYLDSNGWAAIIFVIFLVIWVILDWRARIKTHQGVGKFAIESLLLGFLFIPLVNLTAGLNLIWGLLVLLVMAYLIGAPIRSASAHKDKTHLSTVLALLAFCLYLAGHFDLPVYLGRLMNVSWQPLRGVYGLEGMFILDSTMRFTSTILTLIIAILVIVAIVTGASEAGKRLGTGAYTLGIFMIFLWIFWYWAIGRGESWILGQTNSSVTVVAALDITRRIVSWLLSTLCAFGLGLALGDQSLVVQERQIAFGLQGEKRSISSVVDFVSYATIIALAWMIMS